MPTPVKSELQEPDVFTMFVRSLKWVFSHSIDTTFISWLHVKFFILNSVVRLDHRHKSDSDLVTTIQRAAEQHLESLIPKVCESDREVCALESQVRDLRVKLIGNVMSDEKHVPDNQQINEFNHHLSSIHMEGNQSIKMEMNQESSPRTSNFIEDPCMNKHSPLAKVRLFFLCDNPKNALKNGCIRITISLQSRSTGRPHNVINTIARRSSSDSAQKSPSSTIPYSQAAKKHPDNEEMQYTSADGWGNMWY